MHILIEDIKSNKSIGHPMRDKGIEREWTMMAGDSGEIEGFSHIPSILRKDDAKKTGDPVLTDVVNQDN